MQVKAEGAVQGYVERRSREGKVYRSVDLYVKGRDPGGASIGDSGRSDALDRGVQASRGQASESLDRSPEVRPDRTGLLRSVRVGSLEITAEGGRPMDLTIIVVAVLLLAFLTGLGVGRL